jgi:hypothetical protein
MNLPRLQKNIQLILKPVDRILFLSIKLTVITKISFKIYQYFSPPNDRSVECEIKNKISIEKW